MLPAEPWLQPYRDLYESEWSSFDELCSEFEWRYPDTFNSAEYLCDTHAKKRGRVALLYEDHTVDEVGRLTFWELQSVTNQLANYLAAQGVTRGDRVAVNTPQKRETLISHLAIWKLGAISVPLSVLYGPAAVEYRLSDCEPSICIVDESNLDTFRDVRDPVKSISETIVVGDATPQTEERPFWEVIEGRSRTLTPVDTELDETMLILYSSGTTGPPKGIVVPHRTVIGHLTGTITNLYNCRVTEQDVLWTPSEWAWGAAISNMFAALFFGRPLLAVETGEGFDPELAFSLIDRYELTNLWMVPSALRMMMQVDDPAIRFELNSVRVVASGGESLVPSAQTWATDLFDAPVHEVYGLTETFNWNIGDCSAYRPVDPATMGTALPGHEVSILDPDSYEELGSGEDGIISLDAANPTIFTEYLNKPEKTNAAFHNRWFLTGDIAARRDDGEFIFRGREDDVIISAGYRIGPEEIEDTLISHENVADAGVIGVPDEERGEIPKAFVVSRSTTKDPQALKSELQQFVKETLAAYEYPREVEFVDTLPRTTSGKVRRSELREWEGIA